MTAPAIHRRVTFKEHSTLPPVFALLKQRLIDTPRTAAAIAHAEARAQPK
jgi:hypothetical protein